MSPIEQFELFFDGIMKRDAVEPPDDQRLYRLANKYGVPSALVRVIWFMWKTINESRVTALLSPAMLDRAEKR